MISVLILTYNEELDLSECLSSASWSDDVHVFDSLSTDRTKVIALEKGAIFHEHRFRGYASQRNAALTSIKFKHEWVLLLDADERIPPPLVTEMITFCKAPAQSAVAARIRRRDHLWNTWLKHAQISPFYIRLVRPHKVRYEREVNEILIADGAVAELHETFNHYPFSKGIAHWFDKHNSYSTMEARRAVDEQNWRGTFKWREAFFSNDFNTRRFHQKGLFYRIPGRPLIKLFYMLFVRRAILDGSAGLCYSLLQTIYEYMILLKQREIRLQQPKAD